ncbi:MAG: hypothetical protein M3440_08120 [Chloroflexota bacterium]|nr:hypothetical protein [Chloroflexota bacterium]
MVVRASDDDLELIEPLVEYYAREMGEVAGRLMVALSLLTDLEDSHGWDDQPEQSREAVRCARLLVASVFRIVADADAEAGQGDELGMAEAIDHRLRHMFDHPDGSQRS